MTKSYLSRFFDEGMEKASELISDARKKLDQIDFDSIKKSVKDYANNFYDSVTSFGGKVINSLSDFKLTVPFDADKERFNYKIEDGLLKLKVKNREEDNDKQNSNVFVMTIPSECIAEHSRYKVDRKNNTLSIIIPKDLRENEGLKEIKKDVTDKTEQVLSSMKDFFNGIMANGNTRSND